MTTIPLRLGQGLNDREHWAKRASRVKKEKEATYWSLLAAKTPIPVLPIVVTITRVGPRVARQPLDDDNLVGSAKAVRDATAMYLGVDDGDDRVTWRYAQAVGPWTVRVEFQARA